MDLLLEDGYLCFTTFIPPLNEFKAVFIFLSMINFIDINIFIKSALYTMKHVVFNVKN